VGRDADCGLALSDLEVSRRHARVRGGSTVTVEDLGSHNGSYLHPGPARPGAGKPGQSSSTLAASVALTAGQQVVFPAGARLQVGGTFVAVARLGGRRAQGAALA